MEEIANTDLTEKDLPAPDDDSWHSIAEFALSFDGYSYWGLSDQCGDIANKSLNAWREKKILPNSLTELRTCLFFEKRRWHHFGDSPDKKTMAYLHALIEAIRVKVREGQCD